MAHRRLARCATPGSLADQLLRRGQHVIDDATRQGFVELDPIAVAVPRRPDALAGACLPLLNHKSAHEGYAGIARKFDKYDGYGTGCVRKFAEEAQILGDRSANEWQQHAFGRVQAWLAALEQMSAPKDERPAAWPWPRGEKRSQ